MGLTKIIKTDNGPADTEKKKHMKDFSGSLAPNRKLGFPVIPWDKALWNGPMVF